MTLKIGHSISNELEHVVERLIIGDLELWNLDPALAGLYTLGYDQGRASLAPELEQAQHEAALYYERWRNPGKKFTEMVSRRIDQAAEANAGEPDAVRYYERVLAAATDIRRAA